VAFTLAGIERSWSAKCGATSTVTVEEKYSVVTLRKDGLTDIGEKDGTENDDDSDEYGAEEPDDTHPEALMIAYEQQIDKKRKEEMTKSMENTAAVTLFCAVVQRLNASGLQQKKF
jgi:hypothetical protein